MRRRRGFSPSAATAVVALLVLSAPRAGLATPDPIPPGLRLPAGAAPTGYRVDLTIDPAETTFRGSVDIGIRLSEPTELLWLNAKELTIERASARLRPGGEPLSLQLVPGSEEAVGFAFDRLLPAGEIDLRVDYAGQIRENATQGVFRQKDGEDWYVYTQFQTRDARRAFPCFDEPFFKTPWELTLSIPSGVSAVSNTPIAVQNAIEGGRKGVRFARTDPLPSYLIAFGVGPFDYVDAGRAGMKKTPIRIVVPRGKASRSRYAVEATRPILEGLEAYFGTPFPFSKLDLLAIPMTSSFVAMENPGLITYNEQSLLVLPRDETIRFRRWHAWLSAHEVAHQWFGNLVTLAWWDDVWLNESFANWMSDRVLQEWKPEWNIQVERVVDRSDVMVQDTLVSARKIRQEIETSDDIVSAFDAISYAKGAAVLSMFEAWLGPAKFRSGVRKYIAAHRFGNATAGDFLAALEVESRPGVAAAFSTFLEQAGVPLLDVSIQCEESAPPKLVLSQSRFLPVGTTGSTEQTWQIPVCARSESGRSCSLLTAAGGTMPAPAAAAGCPAWVLANDGEIGYYRTLYRGDGLERLLDAGDRLSVSERVGLLRDVNALAVGGAIPMGQALALAARFANDSNRRIVETAIRIAGDAGDSVLPDELRPAYARYVSKTFGPRARSLGFTAGKGEDEETKLLRVSMVPFVAQNGHEPELQTEARRLALAWLSDRSAVDPDVAFVALQTAGRHGDRALFEKYKSAVRTAQEARDRTRLLYAMGAFPDSSIVSDAYAFAMSDEVQPLESSAILYLATETPEGRAASWDYLRGHYDQVLSRSPDQASREVFFYGWGICDERRRKEYEEFFEDRTGKIPGGPRTRAKILESMDLCIALRAKQEGSLKEELAKY